MSEFIRFPQTPYLRMPEGLDVRLDKVLSPDEVARLLAHEVRVEEKVDGENLGLSVVEGVPRYQSRGSYVDLGGSHFRGLDAWLRPRLPRIVEALKERLVLFGEWCSETHTVEYRALPSWFLLFDVFDRATGTFWSVERRNALAARLGLSVVPQITSGKFTIEDLESLIGPSMLGAPRMEGLVVRAEDRDELVSRAKLVAPGFVQAIGDHWRSGLRHQNRLALS